MKILLVIMGCASFGEREMCFAQVHNGWFAQMEKCQMAAPYHEQRAKLNARENGGEQFFFEAKCVVVEADEA